MNADLCRLFNSTVGSDCEFFIKTSDTCLLLKRDVSGVIVDQYNRKLKKEEVKSLIMSMQEPSFVRLVCDGKVVFTLGDKKM